MILLFLWLACCHWSYQKPSGEEDEMKMSSVVSYGGCKTNHSTENIVGDGRLV